MGTEHDRAEGACAGPWAFSLNVILVVDIAAGLIKFWQLDGLCCEGYILPYAAVVWSLLAPFTGSPRSPHPVPLPSLHCRLAAVLRVWCWQGLLGQHKCGHLPGSDGMSAGSGGGDPTKKVGFEELVTRSGVSRRTSELGRLGGVCALTGLGLGPVWTPSAGRRRGGRVTTGLRWGQPV